MPPCSKIARCPNASHNTPNVSVPARTSDGASRLCTLDVSASVGITGGTERKRNTIPAEASDTRRSARQNSTTEEDDRTRNDWARAHVGQVRACRLFVG